jgi:DNA replication and repair protein RecF
MITGIRLQNFRSYSDDSFEFEPGVNIVVGSNASGKTNLLESVLVLATGQSYRSRDNELVQRGKPWARLDGFFAKQERSFKLVEQESGTSKSFVIDGKEYKRLGLARAAPAVFFEPNHLQLISRGPDQRRDYFDDLLERSQVGYKQTVAKYRRALAQRNSLLKKSQSYARTQLFAWNVRLSELGAQVAGARHKLTEDINKEISHSYSGIARKKSNVSLVYDSQFPIGNYASRLLSELEKNQELDFERGFTGAGPHREDILFYLNKLSVNQTASRGETRSLLLALKIFELELIKKAREQAPIFLLDDVFSELDGARRHALVEHLKGYQTIITTTDAEAVLEYFAADYKILALA